MLPIYITVYQPIMNNNIVIFKMEKKSKRSKNSFSDLFLNDYGYGYFVEVEELDQFSPLEGDIS